MCVVKTKETHVYGPLSVQNITQLEHRNDTHLSNFLVRSSDKCIHSVLSLSV